jgi:hypothetical protein
MGISVLQKIARKDSDKEKIAAEVIKNPEALTSLFEGLNSDKAAVRYGCEKTFRFISEKRPELLYPHFDFFVKMLDSGNNFLKWGAIITIANLTGADKKNRFEKIFDKYFSPITGPVMITAGNTIGSAARIALYKPHLIEQITREILKVEKAKYKTKECVNVACGHAIDSFSQFYDKIIDKRPVTEFIKRQLRNTRVPVRKRAEKFLKKNNITS